MLLFGVSSTVSVKSQTESYGELQGRLFESTTQEAIPFASVALLFNGNICGLAETDAGGSYTIKPVWF